MNHIHHEWLIMEGRRILVVDDSKDITSLIEDILCDDGAHVSTAETGQEAMAMLAGDNFDLLLLDLGMPEPNGWDVLEFIEKTVPHMLVRTAVLTGMCYNRDVVKTLQDKGITHLFKPFQIDSLRNTVCGLLSKVELSVSA